MALSFGTRLGPYEILAPLGAGGMGEVYRARDAKLDRDVAIKVLPQSVAADPDSLARFEREAKAVAALSHQNILAIHDFGNQEGIAYAVMELLEGETLREKLAAGPIPPKQAVDYALQVARGLSAAHEKGIVHRDLKPENLLVSRDGHVKILDFGLAKRVETVAPGQETSAPTSEGHTEPGTVMGTAGYMSPEQVKGLAVDHRSDIFSFGTILYEMLSGRKAFKRDTSAETMAAILRDEPLELTESGRNISPALDRIVQHCLEKDRDRRFQSARDIAFNLSEQSSSTVPSGGTETASLIRSAGFWVAVLPFKSSGDAEMESFADGLSEEITTGLSRFRYLSVVASASTARLKGEEGDERVLGAKVGARYVLDGSIRRGGSAIRLSAQLVDAQTGTQLWAETYNRDLQATSIFAVQDDVAARIVATVADSYGVLVHSMRDAIRRKDADLAPVEWQFQYFAYREQITPASFADLKSRLERVVERDNRQSDLWACLALIYVDEYAFGFPGSDATSLDRALAAGRRAVELDRANQFALVALAQVHFFRQDLAAFHPAAERAMALNPLNTDAVGILGLQIVHTGQFDRGTAIVRRAMELNANHAGWMHFAPLWDHFHKGEYEQALERANRVDVPGLFWPYLVMASACGHLGRRAEAAAAVRDLMALDPEFAAHARSNIASWHFASGLMEPLLEGLRKAGLSIPATDGSSEPPRRREKLTAKAERAESATASGAIGAEGGFRVAVVPFKYGGADASLTALAEGLTEEIVTGLSRFSYLRVIARSGTAGGSSSGREPGARYLMEGSLRQAGAKLRLAVQLVDAASGAHLWAENYERPFRPEAVFELQDDLVPRIVSTVADQYGALVHNMSESLRGRSAGEYSAHEAVLRAFGYWERVTREEHAEVRGILEAALADAPGHSDCLAELSLIYWAEYAFGYNAKPDPLGRARAAAQRAVASAPTSHFAHHALATALFFQKDLQAFRSAADRALALNRMDASTAALLGQMIAYAGDWEYGLGVVDRAIQLNPHHPGWYHYLAFCDAYRRRDYRGALATALKVNMPGYHYPHVYLAAVYGQLGDQQRARQALRELQALVPNFGAVAREDFGKWLDAELTEHLLDGLRKAGLEIPDDEGASASATASDSGAARADEGFWVAVLPFKYGGANAELAELAEGLTEDVVTGLSRFSYLRVIARSSTSRYANESVDVRSAGRELGARYVMEGSLRQAGTKLRLAVQLVDAISGAHLWAENFERTFRPESVFELQDDLVPRIVSMVANSDGVLPHSMSEVVRSKESDQLSPYEAVLRGFGYVERVNAEEHAVARDALERAVQQAPRHADCWAMLSVLYVEEFTHGFNARPDPLGRALAAARRAADAAPSNHLAYHSLAAALFYRRELPAFRNAAERAIALNPNDGYVAAYQGFLTAYAGDWERGCALAERARGLNPNHPGWYWMASVFDAYRRKDYRATLDAALKADMPGFWRVNLALAASYGQLGSRDAARDALQALLMARPEFAERAREELGKSWDPELVEHLLDGLRKAGLDVPAPAEADLAAKPDAAVAIAVLPFSDMSPGKDQDYLCEGMAEEIMNALVRVEGIRVASRTSAFRARKEADNLESVATALSVNHVLEGSVQTSGSRLRVTAQLTDVATGYQLWSERFDRDATDIFAVQDEITAGVVEAVKARLGRGDRRVRARSQVGDLEAYRLYLKGRHLRYTKNDHGGALSCFEQATALDPSHAPSWVGLADVNVLGSAYGLKPSREAYATAKVALETAGRLQGESAEGLYVEAMIAIGERRWNESERLLARATEVDPGHVQARCWTAILLGMHGRTEEALATLEHARQIDPLAPYPYAMTGMCLLEARRPEEAGAYLDQALAFDPDNILALWVSGAGLAARGLFDPAIERLERAVALSKRGAFLHGTLGWALAEGGRTEDARVVLAALRARPATAATAPPEAWILAALGEREEAWRVLDQACDEKQLLVTFTGMPGLDRLRADPRFEALRTRMGLPAAEPSGGASSRGATVENARPQPARSGDAAVAIAVLPFTDMSPAKDQEYLCEGMAEEIRHALVRVGDIRVASRTSTLQARRHEADLPAIGKVLAVGQVLEGSVRTAGDRLRVTAQLTDVASGFQVWSERFDRKAEDVFAVQDDITTGVVDAVRARLSPGHDAVRARPQSVNPEAYRSYLKGRHLRGKEDHPGALRAFQEAVRLDPSHAPSWTGLAEITVLASVFGVIPAREACATARKALATATRLQGESSEGWHVEAFVAWIERRWAAMETAWRRAIELEPGNVLALASFGIVLCTRQRLDEALPFLERARNTDPLSSFPYALTGKGLLNCGRPQEGLRYLEDALSFDKEDATALDSAGLAHVALGHLEEGIATLESVVEITHRGPHFLGSLGWALATAGRQAEARTILAELRARPPGSPTVVSEAWLLGALGEIDAAFEVVRRAEEENLAFLYFTGEPGFDPIRADPRFVALLERLELAPG